MLYGSNIEILNLANHMEKTKKQNIKMLNLLVKN
jgi:hypothetical protein